MLLLNTGTGLGGITLTSIVIVQHHFDEKRALASGITLVGSSVGTVVFNPCFQLLVNILGWRTAILCHAGLVSQTIVLGALLRPGPMENKTKKCLKDQSTEDRQSVNDVVNVQDVTKVDGEIEAPLKMKTKVVLREQMSMKAKKNNNILDISVLKMPAYVVYLIGLQLFIYGVVTMFQHSASRAFSHNISKMQAALLPVSIASSSVFFRIISSFIANHHRVNRYFYMAIVVTSGGVVAGLSCLTSNHFLGSILMCLLFGVFSGQYFLIILSILKALSYTI